jgi:hypothetical protein
VKYKIMKKRQVINYFVVVVICFAIGSFGLSAHAKEIILVGEINDTYQLVAEGEVFDIEDTPTGNDLVQNYISMRVKVIGTVRSGEELRIITVSSFEVVGE